MMVRILEYTNLPEASRQRRQDQMLSWAVLCVAVAGLLGLCLPLVRAAFDAL
jgi:hypothetical protein